MLRCIRSSGANQPGGNFAAVAAGAHQRASYADDPKTASHAHMSAQTLRTEYPTAEAVATMAAH
jgi:hypothetical protein